MKCIIIFVLLIFTTMINAQEPDEDVGDDDDDIAYEDEADINYIEISLNTYKQYVAFLSTYNEKIPVQGIILVFGENATDLNKGTNNGDDGIDTEAPTNRKIIKAKKQSQSERNFDMKIKKALNEDNINKIKQKMVMEFSALGICTSIIQLPDDKSLLVKDMLQIQHDKRDPVLVAVLSFDSLTSPFIRQASQIGGFNGNSISWIIFSSNIKNLENQLNYGMGLRPDSQLLAVALTRNGAYLDRWYGENINLSKPFKSNDNTDNPYYWQGVPNPLSNVILSTRAINLQNQFLSVAIFHDPPFLYVENGNSGGGWLMEIWLELESQLQFKSQFYKPQSKSGSLLRLAEDELKSGRADIVLATFALTLTDSIDFSYPFTSLDYRFYLQRVTTTTSWVQYIEPFNIRMWASVVGLISLSTFLMGIVYTIGHYYGIEKTNAPIYSFKESFMIIYGSLLQQGPDVSPNGIGGRIILWCTFAFSVIIYTAYSAALISKLTIRTIDPPFNSLDEVLQTSYTVYVLEESAPHQFMMTATDGGWLYLNERQQKVFTVETVKDGLNKIASTPSTTYLGVRDRVNPLIQFEPLNCQLTQVPTNILRLPGSFLLQKHSPYKAAIDKQLLLMKSNGALGRWRERHLALVQDDACPEKEKLPIFGLKEVTLPFAIFGSGVVLSIIFLIIEFTVKNLFEHYVRVHPLHVKAFAKNNNKIKRRKVINK